MLIYIVYVSFLTARLVDALISLTDDPGGDNLDPLLCSILAAWAWTQRDNGFGALSPMDSLEGWIADSTLQC